MHMVYRFRYNSFIKIEFKSHEVYPLFFEGESHYVPQSSFELVILLPQPHDSWNYRLCYCTQLKFILLLYNSLVFSIFTKLDISQDYLIPEHFNHPKREPFSKVLPNSQSLKTINLFSVSVGFPRDSSQK
jgi:hypothetical protein